MTEFHARTAERYAELLGRSKGALMKAGQMLSFASFAPAVPEEFQSIYRTALERLCDDVPPMAPELARKVLERELGQRAESAFAQFDWEPLAAASIGQVHAAQLHDGRAVAVVVERREYSCYCRERPHPGPRYWLPRGGSRGETPPGCRHWHRASRGSVAVVMSSQKSTSPSVACRG